jgi:hypothetical protein
MPTNDAASVRKSRALAACICGAILLCLLSFWATRPVAERQGFDFQCLHRMAMVWNAASSEMLENVKTPKDILSITAVGGYLKEGKAMLVCPTTSVTYHSFSLESGPTCDRHGAIAAWLVRLMKSANPLDRAEACRVLAQAHEWGRVPWVLGRCGAMAPGLIALLKSDDPGARYVAVDLLRGITRADYGGDASRWEEWWTGQQAKQRQ